MAQLYSRVIFFVFGRHEITCGWNECFAASGTIWYVSKYMLIYRISIYGNIYSTSDNNILALADVKFAFDIIAQAVYIKI